jgi:sugar lactone lactonase YvrE
MTHALDVVRDRTPPAACFDGGSRRRGVGLAFLISGSAARADTVVSGGLSFPTGVAVDGSGDVFVADTGNNRVVVDRPNGSGGYTQSVVDSAGLTGPSGLALDGSGDLFIVDSGHNRVVVDQPNGAAGYTQSVVDSTGLSSPSGVAVDGSGDVFIADTSNNRVVEHATTAPTARFTSAESPGS